MPGGRKKKLFKKGEVILVEWEDHCTAYSSWTKTEEMAHHICLIKTVGFVVLDTINYLTLALLMQKDNETASQTITIIKSCIEKIKKVKV